MSSMRLAIVIGLTMAGCVLSPVDLTDRPCPCGSGWVCDEARNRCVPPGIDAGPGDASLRDGAEADAPGIDAFVDDPTTACDDLLADAFFCESFEDVSLLRWTLREQTDGIVEHSRMRAFRGTGALRARTAAGAGFAERIATVLGGISDGDVFVRAYVWISSGPPLTHVNLLHIGGHRSRLATEPLAGFNVIDGFASMYIGAANMHVDAQTVVFPRDAWTCVQFQIRVEPTAGEARLWIDDVDAGALVGIDTLGPEPYQALGAGIGWSALEQMPFEVYVDELAVSRTRLPCEP